MMPGPSSRTGIPLPGRVRAAIGLGATLLALLAAIGWYASRAPTSPDPAPAPVDQATHLHNLIKAGDADHQQGRLDEAGASWRRAVRIDPRCGPGWLKLGMLALERGKPAEAVPLLRQAADLDPSSFEPYYNLALSARRLGRDSEAERYQALADRLRSASPPKTTMGMLPRSEP